MSGTFRWSESHGTPEAGLPEHNLSLHQDCGVSRLCSLQRETLALENGCAVGVRAHDLMRSTGWEPCALGYRFAARQDAALELLLGRFGLFRRHRRKPRRDGGNRGFLRFGLRAPGSRRSLPYGLGRAGLSGALGHLPQLSEPAATFSSVGKGCGMRYLESVITVH